MKSKIVTKFFDLKDVLFGRPSVPDSQLVKDIRTHVGVPAAADKKVSRSDLKINDNEVIHIDIGGEGHNLHQGCISGFDTSININAMTRQSAPEHHPIPNLVLIDKWHKDPGYPFADGFADYITMQNAPLTDKNVTEIARCLRPGGKVELWIHPSFKDNMAKLAELLNSKVEEDVVDEFKGSTGSPKFRIISGIKPEAAPAPAKLNKN